MMYKHLFFDFDGTIWDIKANSRTAIAQLREEFGLEVDNAEAYFEHFHGLNIIAWEQYQRNEITKDVLRVQRFTQLLKDHDQDLVLAEGMADRYLEVCPVQPNLVEGAREVLEELGRRFQVHILTNGFDEIQPKKMAACELHGLYQELITPGRANARKPDPAMFDYALTLTGAKREEVVLIGDDLENDVLGAASVGWDTVHFAPEQDSATPQATYTIKSLAELTSIL